MSMEVYMIEPLAEGFVFANAPGCRTRRETSRQYLGECRIVEASPNLTSSYAEIVHTIYDFFTFNTIIDRQVVLLDNGLVRKSVRTGQSDLAGEADMPNDLIVLTSVPVPTVHEVTTSPDFEHLILKKLPGVTLQAASPDLSYEDMEQLADQVVAFVHDWRRLKSHILKATMPMRMRLAAWVNDLQSFYNFRFQ